MGLTKAQVERYFERARREKRERISAEQKNGRTENKPGTAQKIEKPEDGEPAAAEF